MDRRSREDNNMYGGGGVNLDGSVGGTEMLVPSQTLSITRYKALMRWLALCGIVHWTEDLGTLFKKRGFRSQVWLPLVMPLIFVISTILQDYVCYTLNGNCGHKSTSVLGNAVSNATTSYSQQNPRIPFFGADNMTYNSQTLYGWIGLLVAASALHANVLAFARKGKLESLFSRVPLTPLNDAKVRKTITSWVIGWAILMVLTLAATVSFVIKEVVRDGCPHRHYWCIIPQIMQIVSGMSMVCTGVGLSYLVSITARLDIIHTQEQCVAFIAESDLKSQLKEFVELKARIKQLGKDTQIGNAIAFAGGCLCIFGSLWAFAAAVPSKNGTIIWNLSLWMCLISLLLTFLAVFSFSDVTQACDDMMECIRDQFSQYVINKETSTVTVSECFIMISAHQQRFGFEIMGILVEPEIVRAGALSGVTTAAAILKLAI